MGVKQVVQGQYQTIVDRAAGATAGLAVPSEGWVRTVRKALGMSGAQLARRMQVTRGAVNQLEHAEPNGAVTLNALQKAAEAMGCRLVYAIVPPGAVDTLIHDQAERKARALVLAAGRHMALEDQTLAPDRIKAQIDLQAQELTRAMPADFWDDP